MKTMQIAVPKVRTAREYVSEWRGQQKPLPSIRTVLL